MSDRDKENDAGSGSEAEPDSGESSSGELGVVFGGWHPDRPESDAPCPSSGSDADK